MNSHGRTGIAMAALGVGLLLHVAAALRSGAGDGSTLVRPSDAAALAGAACAILGLAALLRQRLGARAGDVVFEGVVAATAWLAAQLAWLTDDNLEALQTRRSAA